MMIATASGTTRNGKIGFEPMTPTPQVFLRPPFQIVPCYASNMATLAKNWRLVKASVF